MSSGPRPSLTSHIASLRVLTLPISPLLGARYAPFVGCEPPLAPFRDAAFAPCSWPLTVLDCARGVARALANGHFDPFGFDVEE